MSASSLRTCFNGFLLANILILPAACFAQTNPAPASPYDYVVSAHELRMSGKARKSFEKGSQLLAKGDTAASLVYLEEAIAEFPEHYKAYYDLGVAHLRLGHTAEAENAFQKSIDLTRGSFAPPQVGMGAVLCQQRQFAQAERVLEKALELDPGSAVAKYLLGSVQFSLNRLAEAERNTQQSLARNANLAEARTLLERIHQRQALLQNAAQISAANTTP